MTPEIWAAMIGVIAGLATGALGWGIEKRRSDRQIKRELISSWRDGIATVTSDDDPEFEIANHPYLRSDWYETLRTHLTQDFRSRYEHDRILIVDGGSGRAVRNILANEVDRVERDWGLRP